MPKAVGWRRLTTTLLFIGLPAAGFVLLALAFYQFVIPETGTPAAGASEREKRALTGRAAAPRRTARARGSQLTRTTG